MYSIMIAHNCEEKSRKKSPLAMNGHTNNFGTVLKKNLINQENTKKNVKPGGSSFLQY